MNREEKNALSRQRILEAALEEFSQKGYEAASLSNVCAEKGISKGIIYHHFKDKDALYLLCVEDCFTRVSAYLQEAAGKLSGTAEEKLAAYFDARLRFFALQPVYLGIFAEAAFNPPAALAEADQLADKVITQVITEDMSQWEKAEALYAYVTVRVSYDQRYYSDRNSVPYESQTALGALRDGMAICGGYAHAVKLLFEKAGIPCFNVTGKYFGENHMWNIALLDGQWLWFDATSDRGSTGEFGFLRFALTELDSTKYTWDQEQVQWLIG